MQLLKTTALLLVMCSALLVAACGGSGGGGGNGGGNLPAFAITGFDPVDIPSEDHVLFRVEGRGFEPIGAEVQVELTALSGTPFSGGLTASRTIFADIDSETRLSGVTRALGISEPVDVYITVILPDGEETTTSRAIATVRPPVLDAVEPAIIRGCLPTRVFLAGTNMGNQGLRVGVEFHAPAGTPFHGGTSSFVEANSIFEAPDEIIADLPWDATRQAFAADLVCHWQSGAEARLPNAVEFRGEETLIQGAGFAGAEAGTSVAVDGDYAVVGMPRDGSSGRAQVYLRTEDGWEMQAPLVPSDGPIGGSFGESVAISGDSILVGCPDGNGGLGAAYVYVRSGVVWREEQRLVPGGGGSVDHFGQAVAIDGNLAVVGAPGPTWLQESGYAYAFTRDGTVWSQQNRFDPGTTGQTLWDFGKSVAIWSVAGGPFVIVGAPGGSDPNGTEPNPDDNTGSVFIYSRVVTSWFERKWFHPESARDNDEFGASVAIHDGLLIVGAPGDDPLLASDHAGSVYVFQGSSANPTTWILEEQLWSPSRSRGGRFGASVALHGNRLVIGEPETHTDPVRAGVAHVFERRAGEFEPAVGLSASDGMSGDAYGAAVDFDGETVLIGAPGNDGEGSDAGQVYVH